MTTACGLDCYDACKIVLDQKGKLWGDAQHPAGNGALCRFLNQSIDKTSRISTARVDGQAVSMDKAMQAVIKAFQQPKSLLWRGSGNVGVMQEVTNLFMASIGGSLTQGSLCDGAGEAGIVAGRGVNRQLPLDQIAQADTVVVWGRNLTVTNAHLLPFIEGKKIVVIDPIKTPIAKKSDLHLSLLPGSDDLLAVWLLKCLEAKRDQSIREGATDEEKALDSLLEGYSVEKLSVLCGIDSGQISQMMEYLQSKKCVFLVGLGVQKYRKGAQVLHMIDTLAWRLGLFGKVGSGVHYLGNSKLGFENPFEVNAPRVSKVSTPFEHFDTVLIQGGNPAESMPHSAQVCAALERVEHLIYFGLYENETSKRARIVIPAKHFLEKTDLRLSYGHHYIEAMHPVRESHIGISEYDFTRKLFDAFDLNGLQSEAAYLAQWHTQCDKEGKYDRSPSFEELPYKDGFGKSGKERFCFLPPSLIIPSSDVNQEGTYHLVTPKSKKSLNTQFEREVSVWLHPQSGFVAGERVALHSAYGALDLNVQLSADVHPSCVVIPSNTRGLNYLTPDCISDLGDSACYQEVKITIQRAHQSCA